MSQSIPVGSSITIGIRPEHLVEGESARGPVVEGSIEVVECLGDVSYLYLRDEANKQIIMTLPGTSMAKPGDQLSVSAETENVHVFAENGRAVR